MPTKTPTAKRSGKTLQAPVTYNDALEMMQNISTLVSRASLSSQLGMGFGGERNYYEIFGYPLTVTYDMLFNMYDRDGISSRAADGIAEESWRKPPIVHDGDAKWEQDQTEGQEKSTPFLDALDAFDEKHSIFALLAEADKMLGYSRFSCLYIGAQGKPEEELTSAAKIAYFEPLDEGTALVSSWDTDVLSERYGLPVKYSINFADQRTGVTAHWSRVIHFREGRQKGSRYYGIPRLQKAYNYLIDLQKVIGGSSEAFWLLIRKGLALVAREGVDMPQPGTAEYKALQDEIDEYEHQLRRVLRLRGVDIQDLGSEVPVADPQFRLLISALAGTLKTPQRILIGSEAGQLASSQDDKNFSDVVTTRLRNFCYPHMAKPTLQRLIDLGALPKPTSGKFSLTPPMMFELTELEKADLAGRVASALAGMTNGAPEMAMPVEAFTQKYLGYVMSPEERAEKVKELLERREVFAPETPPEEGTPPEKETPEGEA